MRFRKTLMKALFEDHGLAIWLLLLSIAGVIIVAGFLTLIVSMIEMSAIIGFELAPGLFITKVVGVVLIGGGIIFILHDFVTRSIKETHMRIEDENMETMAALKGETYDPHWREAEKKIAKMKYNRGSGGMRETM